MEGILPVVEGKKLLAVLPDLVDGGSGNIPAGQGFHSQSPAAKLIQFSLDIRFLPLQSGHQLGRGRQSCAEFRQDLHRHIIPGAGFLDFQNILDLGIAALVTAGLVIQNDAATDGFQRREETDEFSLR